MGEGPQVGAGFGGTVVGCIVIPKGHVHVLTPGTYMGDLFWENALSRYNAVEDLERGSSRVIQMGPQSNDGVIQETEEDKGLCPQRRRWRSVCSTPPVSSPCPPPGSQVGGGRWEVGRSADTLCLKAPTLTWGLVFLGGPATPPHLQSSS